MLSLWTQILRIQTGPVVITRLNRSFFYCSKIKSILVLSLLSTGHVQDGGGSDEAKLELHPVYEDMLTKERVSPFCTAWFKWNLKLLMNVRVKIIAPFSLWTA